MKQEWVKYKINQISQFYKFFLLGHFNCYITDDLSFSCSLDQRWYIKIAVLLRTLLDEKYLFTNQIAEEIPTGFGIQINSACGRMTSETSPWNIWEFPACTSVKIGMFFRT